MTMNKKMVSLAVACLLVFAAVPVVAQQVMAAGNYQVQVMDAYSSEAIAGAEVEIRGVTYYTQNNGKLNLDLPAASYTAYVSAPGYATKTIELHSDYRYSCYLSPSYDTSNPPDAYVESSWRWQEQSNLGKETKTRQLEAQEQLKKRQIKNGKISYQDQKITITDDEVTARGIAKVWVDFEEITEYTCLQGINGGAVVALDDTFYRSLDKGRHSVRVEFVDEQYAVLDILI